MKEMNLVKKSLIIIAIIIFSATMVFAENTSLKIGPRDLIYFIMTDRFNDGDPANDQNVRKNDMSAYHGGDFQGIIDKLDYIQGLGFTAIWISPVVDNQIGGYHGYWATDFYKTDEHFGSIEVLKELTAKAHDKGIKVIVDLVVNHTGMLHLWAGDPQYDNWFHHQGNITNYLDQQEVEEGRLASLPDLNQDNPEVKRYLIDMAKWWIREIGIDGYRLDTVKHVPQSFWVDFVKEIKQEFPDFYMLGEVFDNRVDYIAAYQRTGIDGLADFPIYNEITNVFGGYNPPGQLVGTIGQCATIYENRFLMGTFIDNHDVPRFMNQASNFKIERLKQALAFMMTYTGIPIMYYGTEIGLEGGADPDNRRDMDWLIQTPLFDYVKTLAMLRRSNPALTQGIFQVIKAERGFLCYLRRDGGNIIITAFNLYDQRKQFELMLPENLRSKKAVLKELTGFKPVKTNTGKVRIKMEPRQVLIFRYDG